MRIYILFLFIYIFISCNKSNSAEPLENEKDPGYAFFVAGHTYGNPADFEYGLHPPFVDKIPFINNYAFMQFGILTGDVVPRQEQEYWAAALMDIEKLSMPVHIAAGNHDRGPLFIDIFQRYYYSFKFGNDLFIILSPTNWNIEKDQKDFLIETLNNNYLSVDNIFIFCHELIWWAPDNIFGNVEINFRPHYPGSTNYWSEINPILTALPHPVVLFAGDMGATKGVAPYMYYHYDNITLIGSGMGGGEQDNIVLVEVNEDGILNYRLIGINGDVAVDMAVLEDYQLPK
jgi:hypothetical protein